METRRLVRLRAAPSPADCGIGRGTRRPNEIVQAQASESRSSALARAGRAAYGTVLACLSAGSEGARTSRIDPLGTSSGGRDRARRSGRSNCRCVRDAQPALRVSDARPVSPLSPPLRRPSADVATSSSQAVLGLNDPVPLARRHAAERDALQNDSPPLRFVPCVGDLGIDRAPSIRLSVRPSTFVGGPTRIMAQRELDVRNRDHFRGNGGRG